MSTLKNKIIARWPENKCIVIQHPESNLWMRVFKRGNMYMALLNFAPSGYPGFFDGIEQIVYLLHITNYPEANMGTMLFESNPILPVEALTNLLLNADKTKPNGKKTELDSTRG